MVNVPESPLLSAPSSYAPTWGAALAAGGALLQTVGAYYAVRSQQEQAKSQALTADFEASMAGISARQAEIDAASVLEAGRQEVSLRGLQAAQEKGAAKASAAARGVVGNAGSAAEVRASIEIARRIDALTINRNSLREAANLRRQAQNARTSGALSRVLAANLRRSASTMTPGLAAGAALLGGAAAVGRQLTDDYRYRNYGKG